LIYKGNKQFAQIFSNGFLAPETAFRRFSGVRQRTTLGTFFEQGIGYPQAGAGTPCCSYAGYKPEARLRTVTEV
jgi:hypothetical protein